MDRSQATSRDKAELEDAIHCLLAGEDLIINIIEDTSEDKNYVKVAAHLLNLGKDENPEPNTPLAEYTSVIHKLSLRETDTGKLLMLKDGAKIVISQLAKGKIACQQHPAYSGIRKTYETARQL